MKKTTDNNSYDYKLSNLKNEIINIRLQIFL